MYANDMVSIYWKESSSPPSIPILLSLNKHRPLHILFFYYNMLCILFFIASLRMFFFPFSGTLSSLFLWILADNWECETIIHCSLNIYFCHWDNNGKQTEKRFPQQKKKKDTKINISIWKWRTLKKSVYYKSS